MTHPQPPQLDSRSPAGALAMGHRWYAQCDACGRGGWVDIAAMAAGPKAREVPPRPGRCVHCGKVAVYSVITAGRNKA